MKKQATALKRSLISIIMFQATLTYLLDHLAMVVSNSDRNKMSAQNLAVALAPPLVLHSLGDHGTGTSLSSMQPSSIELDYTQPINVLKYLLQIWPTPKTNQSGNVVRFLSFPF